MIDLISATVNREWIGRHASELPLFSQQSYASKHHLTMLREPFTEDRILDGWQVVSVFSADTLLSGFHAVIVRSIVIVGLVFLITVGLMIFFSRKLSSRLKRLVRSMSLVRDGKFEVEVEDGYEDEVGELNRSFVRMLRRIDQRHQGGNNRSETHYQSSGPNQRDLFAWVWVGVMDFLVRSCNGSRYFA